MVLGVASCGVGGTSRSCLLVAVANAWESCFGNGRRRRVWWW